MLTWVGNDVPSPPNHLSRDATDSRWIFSDLNPRQINHTDLQFAFTFKGHFVTLNIHSITALYIPNLISSYYQCSANPSTKARVRRTPKHHCPSRDRSLQWMATVESMAKQPFIKRKIADTILREIFTWSQYCSIPNSYSMELSKS